MPSEKEIDCFEQQHIAERQPLVDAYFNEADKHDRIIRKVKQMIGKISWIICNPFIWMFVIILHYGTH